MKSSSLFITVITSTLLLAGCFKNSSEGCSSCAHNDDAITEQMQCAACPSTDMLAEQPEINIAIDDKSMPEMNIVVDDLEEEK